MESKVTILPPQDVLVTLNELEKVEVTILDPWYNRGFGGTRPDYNKWLIEVTTKAALISNHVYVWGFPEIVCCILPNIPDDFVLIAWLTWYYKNCPSVIRGWRSSQYTCLHLARKEAKLYPENFLNEKQIERKKNGKLRYMPGPSSVIEAPLNIGFVGRKEQTGHRAQKPISVIEPLILMSTKEGDTVLDPMSGSGTTGEVCKKTGRNAILCDISEEYTQIAERRLEITRDLQKTASKSYKLRA